MNIHQALQQLIKETGHQIVPEKDYTRDIDHWLFWIPYNYPDTGTTLLVLKPMKVIIIHDATIHIHKSIHGDRITIDLNYPNSLNQLTETLT